MIRLVRRTRLVRSRVLHVAVATAVSAGISAAVPSSTAPDHVDRGTRVTAPAHSSSTLLVARGTRSVRR